MSSLDAQVNSQLDNVGYLGSPAHRVLNNDDILHALFQIGCYQNGGVLNTQDLRSCALVSRSFSEPALRVLWHVMVPPTALWRLLLPQNDQLRGEIDIAVIFEQILLGRQWLDATHWVRFLWYARFVRTLHIPETICTANYHVQMMRIVLEKDPACSVFPSVQDLWYSPISHGDTYFHPLFTPQLRIVHLSYSNGARASPKDLRNTIRALRGSAPNIQYLKIDLIEEQLLDSDSIHTLASFEKLYALDLMVSISMSSYRILAETPRLKRLSVYRVTLDGPYGAPPRRVCPRHLNSLFVHGDSIALTELFRSTCAPMLIQADICIVSKQPPAATPNLAACMEHFVRAVSPRWLHHLHIYVGDNQFSEGTSLIDMLAPLFVLCEVTAFKMGGPNLPVATSDADYAAIALAWRKLESFISAWSPPHIPVTPAVLDYFRRYCPRLNSLLLPFLDLRENGRFTKLPLPPPNSLKHGLRDLVIMPPIPYIGDEPEQEISVARVLQMADYVFLLFPQARVPVEERLWEGRDNRSWGRVMMRVRGLQAICYPGLYDDQYEE